MVSTTEARQVCRAVGSLLYPALDFGTKPSSTYPSEDFSRVLTRRHSIVSSLTPVLEHLQLARGEELNLEDRSPLSKSLLYHLGEMDADAIDDQFDGIRGQFLDQARKARRFPNRGGCARPSRMALLRF